jgi:hypothetical protein
MGIVDIVGSNKRLVIGETLNKEDQRSMTISLKRAIMLLQQPGRAQGRWRAWRFGQLAEYL